VRATQQDGSYPRPMLCREQWTCLDGSWQFAHDDADVGLAERWFDSPAADPFARTVKVPYPPESPASGVGDRGIHPVVWYRRAIAHDALVPAGRDSQRVLIHFGAVDYRAQVWFDGQLVASHVGGQTPFTADVSDVMAAGAGEHVLVVRAEDAPGDPEQPRGKQDWRDKPHGIWYERTTGIWQTVWAETVAPDHVADIAWIPDLGAAVVRGEITLAKAPGTALELRIEIRLAGEILAEQSVRVTGKTSTIHVTIEALRNGQDRARLQWTPENPTLLDVAVVLRVPESGLVLDSLVSYFGLRTVSVGGGCFQLNGQSYYLRAVLNQGYRPQTHLATLGAAELRAEVELTKAMGFNTVRIHQKAEDPRFLFWADRLGLLVWAETAAAYQFSAAAAELLVTEWMELVRRDRSHPAIAVWVPLNESWGVPDIASSPAQQKFALALASLTRALDLTRPVVSNEGWEHVDSDILGVHDYTVDAERLRARYAGRQAALDAVLSPHGPQGRRPILSAAQAQKFLDGDAPLMITEFGGISRSSADDAWGYATAGSDSEYATLLRELFDAVRASTQVTGFCYTQFRDTAQETNGLLFADGTAKLPVESIREIVTGVKDGATAEAGSTFGWPG